MRYKTFRIFERYLLHYYRRFLRFRSYLRSPNWDCNIESSVEHCLLTIFFRCISDESYLVLIQLSLVSTDCYLIWNTHDIIIYHSEGLSTNRKAPTSHVILWCLKYHWLQKHKLGLKSFVLKWSSEWYFVYWPPISSWGYGPQLAGRSISILTYYRYDTHYWNDIRL